VFQIPGSVFVLRKWWRCG